MTAFIVPTAEALALNAHLAIVHGYPIQFAYEESFGWVHDSNAFAGLDPQVLEDAVVALEYANSVADYLAPLEMLFQRHCKVYRYLPGEWDRLTPPVTIDYRTGLDRRLERKETFVKGELTMVEYFATASILSDGTLTFSNQAYVKFCERPPEDLLGHGFMPYVPSLQRTLADMKHVRPLPAPAIAYQSKAR